MSKSSTVCRETGFWAVVVVLAACSLVYELLIAETISRLAANTVRWYSITIGVYLGAMGAGAFWYERIRRSSSGWRDLFSVEIWLSLAGLLSVFMIHAGHMITGFLWFHFHTAWSWAAFYGAAVLAMIGVGVLTGMELPLLIDIGRQRISRKETHQVLAADYFGSLLGGIVFPLVLVPWFGIWAIALMTAGVNCLVAALIWVCQIRGRTEHRYYGITAGGAVIALLCLAFLLPGIQQYFLKKYYYFDVAAQSIDRLWAPMPNMPEVQRYHSRYQEIDLVTVVDQGMFAPLIEAYSRKYLDNPSFPRNSLLFIDGDFQLWTDFEELYHEYFAHVPVMINGGIPQEVCVLGGGDGMLVRELLKYTGIRKITLVEIDPQMIALARTHPVLRAANGGALDDPRVDVKVEDAFYFMKHTNHKFDAIYMDFPVPNDYHLSKLYSREFYHFARRRLTENGFAVLDAAGMRSFGEEGTLVEPEEYSVHYQTLRAAGFLTVIPYSSRLETDFPPAVTLVEQMIGDRDTLRVWERDWHGSRLRTIHGKEAITEKILQDFVEDYRQRFYVALPRIMDRPGMFQNYKIPLYILTPERYLLAFDDPPVEPRQPHRVNSVFRPRLPASDPGWGVKMPY